MSAHNYHQQNYLLVSIISNYLGICSAQISEHLQAIKLAKIKIIITI